MDKSSWPAKTLLPVARPGFKFIALAGISAAVFGGIGWSWVAWLCLGAALFAVWFFRDPDRGIPNDANGLISPADGKVIRIDKHFQSEYLADPCIRISIFMNVFNVHVNRIPFSGAVEKVRYSPGRFINASFDKASVHNERNALIIRTDTGATYAVVQIAGLIARRIVNCVRESEAVRKGDRYGMIQFGSRLDLHLPENFEVAVHIGEKTRAGSTIIGYMK